MKTRCPKSVRECIDFIIDESQRKAKKTKTRRKEVSSQDSIAFSSGSDRKESSVPVRKLRNSLDNESEMPSRTADEKMPEQETRADRAFFVPAKDIELSTHDKDDFPLSLKELTLMGGTRSETRKIVAVSEDKSLGNRRRSVKTKKTKVVEKKLEVGRRPRGRPRKHKLEESGNALKEEEKDKKVVEETKAEKKQSFVFKEIENKRDEDVFDNKDNDQEETTDDILPKRKKSRIIDDEDDSELEEEISGNDSMSFNEKKQSVSNRSLFDILVSPHSDTHTGTTSGKDCDYNSAENGTSPLSRSISEKLAEERDLVMLPSVNNSPRKPIGQYPEDIKSSSLDIEAAETSENSKAEERNFVMLPSMNDSPRRSIGQCPEDARSPSLDIESAETTEDSKPAENLLEFDFDDFSPDEDSDMETGEKNTVGTKKCEEAVSFVKLKQAVREGDVDTVRWALNAKCDVDQADGINGMTLLMWAAMEGQVEVAALLSRQADVNAKQRNGSTALMVAAEQGFDNICEILLEAGAHLNLAQQTGETALMKAAKKGHVSTVNVLLRNGVDFRALSSFGHSASSYAQRNHHLEVQTMIGHHAARVTRSFEGKAGEIASRDSEVLVMPPLLPPTLRVPSELSKMDFSISLTPEHKLDGCEVNLFVLTVELDVNGGITVGELPPITQYNFSCHFSEGRVSWKNASVCLLPSISAQNKLEFLATGFKSHKVK
jgi:hypothetical protein